MADAADRGSLAPEDTTEHDAEGVAEERGLPESASNYEPLPLEAIDEMVNKAEGDHEALETNAAQEKVVRETEGLEFDGLTSVDQQLRDEQLAQIREEAPGATTGEAAASPAAAEAESSSDSDATDSARELAAERGIDLSTVEGTGADGRITKSDVEAASA